MKKCNLIQRFIQLAIILVLFMFPNSVFAIVTPDSILGNTVENSSEFYLNNPVALSKDIEGNIYVADMGNHRIIKLSPTGELIKKFGTLGSQAGQFDTPFGVAIDNDGNILVADTANNRIQKFDSEFNFIKQWGEYGSNPGQFGLVREIAVDSLNRYHVCDEFNDRIQVFDDSGTFLYQYGNTGTNHGEFNLPQGIAIRRTPSMDYVYVCDTYNNRIQVFDINGNYIEQLGSLIRGDGSYAFYHPRGVNIDINGDVYVADTYNHKIKIYDSSHNHLFSVSPTLSNLEPVYPCQVLPVGNGNFIVSDTGNSQLIYRNRSNIISHFGLPRKNNIYSGVTGVTIDNEDNVYVSDSMNHRIIKYDNQGNIVKKWGGNNGQGGTNSYGLLYWQFTFPKQVYFDNVYNRIIIADTGNSRIQVFNKNGSWISNFGYGVFKYPMGVCTDNLGNIYISDTGNNRIMKCNPYGIMIRTWGGFGTSDGHFNGPSFISCDSHNNVYVVDRGNCRIQKFNTNGEFITKWGTNSGNSLEDPLENQGHNNGELFFPIGIAVDEDDFVYVSDSSNNRVQVFTNNGDYVEQFGYFSGKEDGFFSPQGIAIKNSKIYVADPLLNRITILRN